MTALYHEHALGLTRLAHVMLGDRATAEDVVQEAFTGLFRRWMFLDDTAKAPAYLRSAVLNGCRTVARRSAPPVLADVTAVDGADMPLLAAEERRAVLAALRELPGLGSGRRWCCATSLTCLMRRSPGPWASSRGPSGRPCTAGWPRWSVL